MRMVKDMTAKEIRDYINKHDVMKLKKVHEFIEDVLMEEINTLDMKKVLTKILPKHLTPKSAKEIIIATDDKNTFDNFNEYTGKDDVEEYKKYLNIKEAYIQAVEIRLYELSTYIFEEPCASFRENRKFIIPRSKEVDYLVENIEYPKNILE